jgi:ATP-binding cassette, subfamily C (CFTR/MRP), member 4
LFNEKKRKEIVFIMKKQSVVIASIMLSFEFNSLIIFSALSAFIIRFNEQPLKPNYIILTISYYTKICNYLQYFCGLFLINYFNSKISINRIQSFLLCTEADHVCDNNINVLPSLVSVNVENFSASWYEDRKHLCLKNINLKGESNDLIIIVGKVGSGKTSLLMGLLGEIPFAQGNVQVKGSVFYVSQEPWIFSASVKQNILFGKDYDKKKFKRVLEVCCLDNDIQQLPNGINTLIGEKGTNLSGGQRARISLARAAYSEAQIIIFDDPLSAIDVRVGKKIFDNCINGLLKTSLRVLVTHQKNLIKKADKILLVNDGAVTTFKSYANLSNIELKYFDISLDDDDDKFEDDNLEPPPELEIKKDSDNDLNIFTTLERKNYFRSTLKSIGKTKQKIGSDDGGENQNEGSISWYMYIQYFTCGYGSCGLLLIFILYALVQFFMTFNEYWLVSWANIENIMEKNQQQQDIFNNDSQLYFNFSIIDNEEPFFIFQKARTSRMFNYFIYSLIILSITVFGVIRSIFFIFNCKKTATKLHERMMITIISSPMKFFDFNPHGRIINRFSEDTNSVDEMLPEFIFEYMLIGFSLVGSIIFNLTQNYLACLPVIPLALLSSYYRQFYMKTNLELKRLQSIYFSPILDHTNNLIQGIVTIRAARNVHSIIENEFKNHLNLQSRCNLTVYLNRWFSLRLDLLLLVYIVFLSYSSIFGKTLLNISSGAIGLILVQAMNIVFLFQWFMRLGCLVETKMISFERIKEYCEIDVESLNSTNDRTNWPNKGEIRFENVSLSYNSTSKVLKNVSFIINDGEKIGIVGRTGAGKSSLIQAIFRIVETEGNIFIDNQNIKQIDLNKLRKSLSIIPV